MSFCTKGYVEIQIQRPFFDNKKGIWKILVVDIKMEGTCFGVPCLHRSFFFEKHQNPNFWWYFKVSGIRCLWVDFGYFGQF
jgi:hypothetical protein